MVVILAKDSRTVEQYFTSKRIYGAARKGYVAIFNLNDLSTVGDDDVTDIIYLDGYWQNPMYEHWAFKRLEENVGL